MNDYPGVTSDLDAQCRCCRKGIEDGVWLTRFNPKGMPGIWTCVKCYGRNPCVVPFCRRTRAQGDDSWDTEWICAVHWREVPRAAKAELATRRRRWKRYQTRGSDIRFCRQWARCKAFAIERAMGIA